MALTKCFVILFLVYLNFDISPINSAAIPERLDSPDSINENDENSESYTTTGATEEDIGKIFETYENLYIKKSNWFNDDKQTTNANNEKLLETQPDDESTSRDLETTEPTADDVVESIHNIIDEKIDAKKNRTDRTIVVVVTTNVFNINGSEDSNKRQHTLLSFGTPGMIHKETPTDTTLAMHNKITTEFFNSNPSPIAEQSETLQTNIHQKSITEGSETIESTESDDDSAHISQLTEAEQLADVSSTWQPRSQGGDDNDQESEIDVRQPDSTADIQSAKLNTVFEGRSFNDESANDDSNDVLAIMKIIPNRSMDEPSSLSKPFEIPVQEPQDSSLMEAIENILDTDVRKAFERDIPQTRHVPFDINIEEEALYAPLKDLSEYIVEEVPISGNYDIFTDNLKTEDKTDKVEKAEEVESSGKIEKSLDMKDSDYFTESDNLTHEAVTEIEQKTTTTTTTTTVQPTIDSITEETTTTPTTITDEEEAKTIVTEAPVFKETTSTTVREDEGTTKTTDAPESNAAQEIEDIDENGEFISTTTNAHHTYNIVEKFREENRERVETLQKSSLLEKQVISKHGELSNSDSNEATESTVENQSKLQDKVHDTSHISNPNDEPAPITYSIIEERDEKFNLDRVEKLQSSNSLEKLSKSDNYEATESIEENQSELLDKVPETLRISNLDVEPTTTPADLQETFLPESLLSIQSESPLQHTADDASDSLTGTFLPESILSIQSESPLQHTADDASDSSIGTFEKLVDNSFEEYPIYVHLDTTTEYVTYPNLYIGASFSGEQVAELLEEAELAKTASSVQILSSIPDDVEFSVEENPVNIPKSFIDAVPSDGQVATLFDLEDKLNEVNEKLYEANEKLDEAIRDAEMEKMRSVDKLNFIEVFVSTTTKPDCEDVVSEVVRVDEETTEQHQIIKKPGVEDAIVELKTITVIDGESNNLLDTKTANFESRSFSDNDDPADPLRTLIEAVELTADITKSVDNFQGFSDPIDSIPFAANQVIENKDDMALVKNDNGLNIAAASVWCGTAVYMYCALAVLSIGLIVLLGIVSYLRFRQFKRNILFSC